MLELKTTPKGIKVNNKLFIAAGKLRELFATQSKSDNRKVRKALYGAGHRGLASVR